MAHTDHLTADGPAPSAGTAAESPDDPDPSTTLGSDRTPQRATIYWVLLLVLLAGAGLLSGSPWQSGREVHTLIETASTVLAAVIGSLALVRFYSRKRGTYLFIGTGFLGTAVLEGFHALVSSPLSGSGSLAGFQETAEWSWIGSRLFLALFLFASWAAWRREDRPPSDERGREWSVYLTGILLTGFILGLVAMVSTVRAYYPELPVHRPAELLPAGFFLFALAGYLSKGRWRRDPFEHWLVVALLLNAVAHAVYMPFSARLHDAAYDAGHLLKLVSYVSVLTGLLVSIYVTFRREERAVDQIRTANEALAREVSDRRRAEQILQESEDRLKDFLDNAHDLIQSTAPDGTLTYVNRAWTRTLGFEEEEAVGRNLLEFVHPSSRRRCREQVERVLERGTLARVEVDFVSADGRLVVCSGSLNCRFEGGKAVAVRGIFRDVTEQRRVERKIAASQANLEALVESTGDAIWSVDADHRLITFNTAFALSMEARTGREPAKGDAPEQIFPPTDVRWYRAQYDRALSGERYSVLRTDEFRGQTRHFEFFFNPIVEDRGICGVVAFGRDVTRRIAAEEATRLAKEEAEAANRAKSQFLANMSHELRTPLNSIIGFTNILLKNKEENLADRQMNFLDRVLANGRHLLTLINEVLDLAKVEAGRMELELESVDLAELIGETLAQLEGQVRANKGERVRLRPSVPDDLAPLQTDRAKLKQVIINLVGNALKFTEEGEVAVIVEAGRDGRTAHVIHVKDTGIGIPDDRLEAIFEAFQQADASTSRKFGGTGLGLTISRSICQMLGYEMRVSSEVGAGSTFSIHLGERPPRRLGTGAEAEGSRSADAEASASGQVASGAESEGKGRAGPDGTTDAPAPEESAPVARAANAVERPSSAVRGFRVLVIDDEGDSRLLMSHFLKEFGCEILTATSAEQGIQLARTEEPDLITLDLKMPGTDGWQTLRTLKNDPALRPIPVVVVSIVASENRGKLLGAVDLINKPVEREDLLRVLWRNLLRRHGGRVLVVEDDRQLRGRIRESLEEVGLEVVTADHEAEALRMLGREGPGALVLDVALKGENGMSFLERLREVPEYVGIPVLALVDGEPGDEERRRLLQQASGVVHREEEDMELRLREYLGTIFQLDDGTSRP